MKNNEEQFIQDVLDTFDNTTAYKSAIFSSAFFGFVGVLFSIMMMEDVIPYIHIYPTYLAFFGLSLFCIIGGILCVYALVKHYILALHQSHQYKYISYLYMVFLAMIPGLIMVLYISLVENSDLIMPISYTSFYLCIYAIFVFLIFYGIIKIKIQKEEVLYQKKTFRFVQWCMIIVFMIAFFLTLIFAGSGFEDIPKILLVTFIVTFCSYQAARLFVADMIIKKMDMEFMDYEKLYYDGNLGELSQSAKARVTIINDGYMEKALDIVEEFGFQRNQCMNAILKNKPFFTFDEKMYYDLSFMKKLLMRFAYEDVSYKVDIWTGKKWINSDCYNQVEQRCFMRKKKRVNKQVHVSSRKSGWLVSAFSAIIAIVMTVIYGVWAAIFPVNYFRPVRWSKPEQIQNSYREFTYISNRTIYHMICMWVVFLLFLCIPSLQEWYCGLIEGSLFVVGIIFCMFFVAELFIFPLYIKNLKKAINQEYVSHNYEKNAFIIFIIYSLIRMFMKGWQRSLATLVLLVLAVELAKSIHIAIRYIYNRNMKFDMEENELYEIVEEYDINPIKDRLNKYTQDIIKLTYSYEEPTRYSSQLGGIPYLLKGQEFPQCDNEPLIFLAQINFDELQENNLKEYPQQGMLQFFIKSEDFSYDFDRHFSKCKVIYHKEIDYNQQHLQSIDDIIEFENSPIIQPCRLNLSVVEEKGVFFKDYLSFDKLKDMCQDILPKDFMNNEVLIKQITDYCTPVSVPNKIGGQGHFICDDPRQSPTSKILLQLTSDGDYMVWSYYGTCHFFIEEKDLRNRDFDNVTFTWDSYKK